MAEVAVNSSDKIQAAVLGWEGTSAHPHRFSGTEYRLGGREIGHIHGERLIDIPFPRKVRDEIVSAGLAQPHHVLSQSGWVSYTIGRPEDVQSAIELLRRSYDLAMAQRAKRHD